MAITPTTEPRQRAAVASLGFQNCGGQPIYTYTPTHTGSGSEVLDPGRSTTDSAESTVVLEHSSTSALSVSLELDAMSTGEERRLYLIGNYMLQFIVRK